MLDRMKNYNKILEKFQGHKNGLIIHHWDTDGVCSAALLYEKLKGIGVDKIDTRIPEIGNYFLTEDEIDEISKGNYEFISIVDVCFPRENLLLLKEKSDAEIFVFDHHLQKEIKEVNHFNEDRYPSASWLLTKIFKLPVNLLSVLGVVGDKEEKIRENREIYPEINSYLKSNDLSFQEALRMANLIDSNYKIGNKRGVEESVFFLMKNKDLPVRILEHKNWITRENELKSEVKKQLSKKIKERDNFLILDINSKYNIISAVTRKLAFENSNRFVIVINHGFLREEDQVYIRGKNVQGIIETARGLGYSAGGKKDVIGAVIPKDRTENFVEDIIKRWS